MNLNIYGFNLLCHRANNDIITGGGGVGQAGGGGKNLNAGGGGGGRAVINKNTIKKARFGAPRSC